MDLKPKTIKVPIIFEIGNISRVMVNKSNYKETIYKADIHSVSRTGKKKLVYRDLSYSANDISEFLSIIKRHIELKFY